MRDVKVNPMFLSENGLLIYQGVAEEGAQWESFVDDTREERTQSLISWPCLPVQPD